MQGNKVGVAVRYTGQSGDHGQAGPTRTKAEGNQGDRNNRGSQTGYTDRVEFAQGDRTEFAQGDRECNGSTDYSPNNSSSIPSTPLLTLHIPMTFKKKSGRKEIILPPGYRDPSSFPSPSYNPAVQKPMVIAISLGHRWLGLLTKGKVKSIGELEDILGIDGAMIRRYLNLTCLPPRVILEILEGWERPGLSLENLRDWGGGSWEEG